MNKPFTGDYRVSLNFGVKYTAEDVGQYTSLIGKSHSGVDWALPCGTKIIAPSNCVVVRVEKWRMTGFGKTVYLLSNNGRYEMFCAHMSEIVVSVGSKLHKGDLLGYSGSTGYSTGCHVHFEMKRDGILVDPLLYLDDSSHTLLSASQNEKLTTDTKKEYTIKQGDSLWSISKEYFGTGNFWTKIYNLNSKKIGRNPNHLRVGIKIEIPTN